MTQVDRVLKAAQSFAGTCQAEWLDHTPDGGPRITRVAARIQDLEERGHVFELLNDRKGTRVYRWVEGPGVESGARGIIGVGTRGDLDASLPINEGALPNQVQASTDATPSLALDSGVERGTGHAHVAQDHVGVSSAGVALSPGRLFEVGVSQYGFADQERAA